ncbi:MULTISPECIES: endonuclease [Pseudomonadaceae]|jgi:deoxyribonuclease-1|uniref:DNA-specific endonuclease I n=1 Tax=Metapseudomonas otitidis TaxID=319939 RepID=A0A679GB56_9GAMM|nr:MULTISPECIES: endonuclease I family protein [Pseudomonas]MDL5601070.1 endonuclease I family protein [Bacillus subtilis]KIV62428.1 Endonuclease I precursor [Pseudomonas sp. FeS53a]MCO7556950.1 endonuclease I family protein [Pseudomonas otitidis]MDH1105597.1 endonuclease I family protein [Pseudomonas otitidis]MDH1159003.1 endonuclease I family protein [Pseudomonas otitidis]
MIRFVLLLSLLLAGTAQAAAPRTFQEAKKAAWKLYASHPVEFYCGCRYSGNKVDLKSCGYVPRTNAKRASRIEWEHIVPAWVIGHQRKCWQNGGRENCARHDDAYRRAEADLHNLVPSIGEVNGDRSNYGFGWLPQAPSQYGACPMVVDFKARKAMPRQQIRGMIARTYFYMSERYGLRLSKQDRQLYTAWNKQYPVEAWERNRNQRVACVMGHGNHFVGAVNLKACK